MGKLAIFDRTSYKAPTGAHLTATLLAEEGSNELRVHDGHARYVGDIIDFEGGYYTVQHWDGRQTTYDGGRSSLLGSVRHLCNRYHLLHGEPPGPEEQGEV
jgi:hypothetical protein